MTVRAGLVSFDPQSGCWLTREEPLGQFVRWVLGGTVELLSVGKRPPQLWWTSRKSIRTRDAWEAARAEQERDRLAAEERRRKEAEEEARRRREEWETERLRVRDEAERANPALRYQRKADEHREQQRAELTARLARQRRERSERWAQQEASALAAAERFEERERAGAAWWERLPQGQVEGLFAAVVERARAEGVTISIAYPPRTDPQFAYGVPVYRGSPIGLYGVVRPCPDLLDGVGSDHWPQTFFLSGEEVQAAERFPGPATHFMCGSNGSAS
ncbi:hypothetical protein [Streptomyces sp. NBC_01244]|uniref:hypothetical protein n=1 Tax=Streptomyces sp. NBC_01244 TaxID=2903797 RepID=UPI002E10424C|nr:hypothetical protein OG247_42345 [Streptomyces sp. NBC_01244]